jgi:hypothetical protein
MHGSWPFVYNEKFSNQLREGRHAQALSDPFSGGDKFYLFLSFSSRVGAGKLFCGFIYGVDGVVSLVLCSTATEMARNSWFARAKPQKMNQFYQILNRTY